MAASTRSTTSSPWRSSVSRFSSPSLQVGLSPCGCSSLPSCFLPFFRALCSFDSLPGETKTTVSPHLPGGVSDGQWHVVEVHYYNKVRSGAGEVTQPRPHPWFSRRAPTGPRFSRSPLLRENTPGERSGPAFPAGDGTFHSSEEVALLQRQVARQRPHRSSVLSAMTLLCQVVAKVRKWNLVRAAEETKGGRLFLVWRPGLV